MADHSIIDLFKKRLKSGDDAAAIQWLQSNGSDRRAQLLLCDWWISEQNVKAAQSRLAGLAAVDDAIGLLAQSIQQFLLSDYTQAVDLADSALRQFPDDPLIHNHLGRALQNAGLTGRAIKSFKTAVRLDPEYAHGWHNLAHTRRAMGAMDQAIEHYQTALKFAPTHQSSWFNLGISLCVLNQHEAGLNAFDRLLKINPDHIQGWINRGLGMQVLNRFDEALISYDRAMDLAPDMALPYTHKGILLNQMQETTQAIRCLQHATRLNVHDVDAWCELANVYEKTNQLEEAFKANQTALRIDPKHPTALIDGARLQKRIGEYHQASELLKLVNPTGLPSGKAVEFWYELGDVEDKRGRYDLAFEAYVQANQLATHNPIYQRIDQDALDRRLQRRTQTLGRWQQGSLEIRQGSTQKPQTTHAPNQPKLCFLLGFPRSGTTLMDTILNAHDQIQTIEEKPTIETVVKSMQVEGSDFWSETFLVSDAWRREFQQRYWDEVKSHVSDIEGTLVVDKLPFRFLDVQLLQAAFPQAQFVFMQRHPADVVLSNFMQNFAPTKAFVHFNQIDHAAETYRKCMQLWSQLAPILGNRLKTVVYESLVSDPEPQVMSVCDFLGLPFAAKILDASQRIQGRERIATNSYAQVTDDIHERSKFRWRHYCEPMDAVKEVLNPVAHAMGYPILEAQSPRITH